MVVIGRWLEGTCSGPVVSSKAVLVPFACGATAIADAGCSCWAWRIVWQTSSMFSTETLEISSVHNTLCSIGVISADVLPVAESRSIVSIELELVEI